MNHRWKIGSEWLWYGITMAYLFYIIHHYTIPRSHLGSGCGASKTCYISAMNRSERALMFSFCTSEMPCGAGELIAVFSVISSQQDVAKGIVELQWKNRRPFSSFQPPQAEITLKLLPSPEAECQRHQMTSEDQTDETCCLMLTYVVFGAACDSCLWLWISPVLPPPSAWR